MSKPGRSLSILACTALVCMAALFPGPGMARAQPLPQTLDEEPSASPWHLAFLGGVLMPLGDMTDSHQQGLVASTRLGWTSRVGLGLELAANYSPLPRQSTAGRERVDAHFLSAGLLPRFTLGHGGSYRAWLGGGGGVAFERTRHMGDLVPEETRNAYAPAVMGAAGLEMHFLSGGGLGVVGSYMRTYGDELAYELFTVTGGLVLAF